MSSINLMSVAALEICLLKKKNVDVLNTYIPICMDLYIMMYFKLILYKHCFLPLLIKVAFHFDRTFNFSLIQ